MGAGFCLRLVRSEGLLGFLAKTKHMIKKPISRTPVTAADIMTYLFVTSFLIPCLVDCRLGVPVITTSVINGSIVSCDVAPVVAGGDVVVVVLSDDPGGGLGGEGC